MFGVGRRYGWPEAVLEQVLALVVGIRALSLEDPLAPAVHLMLAGVFRQLGTLLSDIDPLWGATDDDTARRWQRDRPLLDVGSRARGLRRVAARRHFSHSV